MIQKLWKAKEGHAGAWVIGGILGRQNSVFKDMLWEDL